MPILLTNATLATMTDALHHDVQYPADALEEDDIIKRMRGDDRR